MEDQSDIRLTPIRRLMADVDNAIKTLKARQNMVSSSPLVSTCEEKGLSSGLGSIGDTASCGGDSIRMENIASPQELLPDPERGKATKMSGDGSALLLEELFLLSIRRGKSTDSPKLRSVDESVVVSSEALQPSQNSRTEIALTSERLPNESGWRAKSTTNRHHNNKIFSIGRSLQNEKQLELGHGSDQGFSPMESTTYIQSYSNKQLAADNIVWRPKVNWPRWARSPPEALIGPDSSFDPAACYMCPLQLVCGNAQSLTSSVGAGGAFASAVLSHLLTPMHRMNVQLNEACLQRNPAGKFLVEVGQASMQTSVEFGKRNMVVLPKYAKVTGVDYRIYYEPPSIQDVCHLKLKNLTGSLVMLRLEATSVHFIDSENRGSYEVVYEDRKNGSRKRVCSGAKELLTNNMFVQPMDEKFFCINVRSDIVGKPVTAVVGLFFLVAKVPAKNEADTSRETLITAEPLTVLFEFCPKNR